jgi:uncharacterized membrane protein YgcG
MKHPKQLLTALLFFTTCIFIFNRCRKMDMATENLSHVNIDIVPPSGSDPAIKRVAGFLTDKNKRNPFLENLIRKQGRPAWKGALVLKGSSYSARSASDSTGNADVVVIPLVLDSTHYVHSMLICKLETDTVLIKLLKARDYDTYSFNTGAPVTAQDIARQFMILENTTFNHTRFKITDSRLFPHTDSNGRHPFNTIYKFSQTTAISARGLTLSCYTTYEKIDYWICPFGNGEGDHDCGYDYYDHTEVVPKTTCFWLDDGTGSGGGGGDGGVYTGGGQDGGGSGGGSGGGGGTTPGINDPCAVNGQPAATLCGGGWEPVDIDPPYVFNELTKPCLKAALQKLSGGVTKTFFKDIYNTFDTSTIQSLLIQEKDLTLDSAYGMTYLPMPLSTGSYINIELDTIKLLNCSQEWMAYVMVHEIAHAGMYANVFIWDTANPQHYLMVTQYLTKMANSLMIAYPSLSEFDAYAMCFAGFYGGIEGSPSAEDIVISRMVAKKIRTKFLVSYTDLEIADFGWKYTEIGTKGLRGKCN